MPGPVLDPSVIESLRQLTPPGEPRVEQVRRLWVLRVDLDQQNLGKSTGLCGGFGGHMHLFDLPRRFLGTDPIVGAGMALAAGAALSLKHRHEDGVAVTLLGDGALGTGIAHEIFNIARLWSLPVLFVVILGPTGIRVSAMQ